MRRKNLEKFFSPLILSLLILGTLSIGLSQQIITTSSTTLITIPETTLTTVISKPGTTKTVTIVHGGYRVIYIEKRPNQECVLVVKGTPIKAATMPGTTVVYTLPASTYETTIIRTEGGTTLTTTRPEVVEQVVTVGVPPVVVTMTASVPVYGEVLEHCQVITVTIINRIEASEGATVLVAFPGFTLKGTVFTIPTLLATQPVTTTKTMTKTGITYTRTIERSGETTVKTIVFPGTTVTKTIVKSGKVITSIVTYVTTISKPLTQTTHPPKPPKKTTKPPKPPKPPKPSKTITTSTTQAIQQIPTTLLLILIAAAALIIVAAAIILLSRKHGERGESVPPPPPPPPTYHIKGKKL